PQALADEGSTFAEGDEPADDPDAIYGAAYENVVFRDSAQDGHSGDTVDDSGAQFETDLDRIAVPLETRIRFLVTLSQAWDAVTVGLKGLTRGAAAGQPPDGPDVRSAPS